MRICTWLGSAPLLIATLVLASAQQIGDPVAGRRLAEGVCLQCHSADSGPKRAPTFAAVAAMPSTTAQALGVFLKTSHPTMPNIMLSDNERDDVIAYILSLRH